MGKLRFRRVSKRGWDWAGGTAAWPVPIQWANIPLEEDKVMGRYMSPALACFLHRERMRNRPPYPGKVYPVADPLDPESCSVCHWYSP